MEEPNKYYRPVHRPHKKLRFPGMGGGDDHREAGAPSPTPARPLREVSTWSWADDLIPKVVPLVVVLLMGYALYDAFRGGAPKDEIIRDPAEIVATDWNNARVRRKFADVTPKRTRYYLELEDAAGKRVLFDFEKENTLFWDRVDVRNRLTKPAGSDRVFVDTYTRDTTYVMRFK
jgi:hypothetical protein